jgi:hypothetical protein
MNQTQRALIHKIEDFCRRSGMGQSAFGVLCVNDAHLVRRLRRTFVTTNTAERIDTFIAGLEQYEQSQRDRQAFIDWWRTAQQRSKQHKASAGKRRSAAQLGA